MWRWCGIEGPDSAWVDQIDSGTYRMKVRTDLRIRPEPVPVLHAPPWHCQRRNSRADGCAQSAGVTLTYRQTSGSPR